MPTRHFAECPHCGGKYGGQKPLTRCQANLFRYLKSYIDEHLYAPSFEEIATHFGYSSLATVHEHLSNLEYKGWVKRHYNESRAITILVDDTSPTPSGPV